MFTPSNFLFLAALVLYGMADGSVVGGAMVNWVLGITDGLGSGRFLVRVIGCLLNINASVPLFHSRR